MRKTAKKVFFVFLFILTAVLAQSYAAFASGQASGNSVTQPMDKATTLWDLILAGGACMVFLGALSLVATTLIIYHFWKVTAEKLTPVDFIENLLSLIERKHYDKAVTVCSQQSNLISEIALPGLKKVEKGAAAVEEKIQSEGRARLERLWQNLTYIGDIAIISPMVGLLGTILGMIEAFNYFRAGTIHPVVLTQGLAKAMINTAFGLVIAVPCLIAYSYLRGRVSRISSTAESVSSEIVQLIKGGR